MNQIKTILTLIAQEYFDVETLIEGKSDRFDYLETTVLCIRDALEAAFKAGIEVGASLPKATESEIPQFPLLY